MSSILELQQRFPSDCELGDSNEADGGVFLDERYVGIGLGYTMDDWAFAANWWQYSEDDPGNPEPRGQKGYALVANCDLGGGAQVETGYSKSTCATETVNNSPFPFPMTDGIDCGNAGDDFSRISLGVAMSF